MSNYEALRRRHCGDARALDPVLGERLGWSKERLDVHRRNELRSLLRHAIEQSPWHRRRLAHIDPETFEEADLARLPAMTKDDLMDNFDEIVTDRRLTLDLLEAHLAALTTDAYVLDRYHALASSGSSGRRGLFVFDWSEWAIRWLSNVRRIARAGAPPGRTGPVPVMAIVAAGDPSHGTSALSQTFDTPHFPVARFPVTSPLSETVRGLNAAQPSALVGYPSALLPLVDEARGGRLRIVPRCVATTSEPLTGEVRSALEETWGVPVTNIWSSSEAGGMAVSCDQGPGLHLSEDLVVVEPVDACGRPVSAGTRSAKVLLTSLYGRTLPLIRYEIGDQVTLLDTPCACGSAHRRIGDVEGRLDSVFVYDRVTVSSLAFTSPLNRQRHVLDYQVRQTPTGAIVAVRHLGPLELPLLEAEITEKLRHLGLPNAEVTVIPVDELHRGPTGKLSRFVPLTQATATA